jgi:hypothetical protein
MSREQNAGKDRNLETGNESFETVEQLAITVTNQNSIHEEIKSRLKSRNACYNSVQNLVFLFTIQKSKD